MRISSLKFSWQLVDVWHRALLVAVLCHVSVLAIFIFTFNIPVGAHKPTFIFLGSLLTNRDFSSLSLSRPMIPKKIVPAVLELSTKREKTQEYPYAVISKPVYSALLGHLEKITMKPTVMGVNFKKPDARNKKSEEKGEKGSGIFPYIPLRMYNK